MKIFRESQNPFFNQRFVFNEIHIHRKAEAEVEAERPKEEEPEKHKLEARSLLADAPAAEVTDVDTLDKKNPAGMLHQNYLEKIKIAQEESTEKDRKKLGGSSIADIRFNTRLLNPSEAEENPETQRKNLKAESARRMAAYTVECDEQWYTLDYTNVGGEEHLYGIGLGDILLDPDIEEILVDRGGELIHARRGVPKSGRHKDRQSFVDQDGNYVATYNGDRFKILSGKEIDLTAYIQKLNQENEQKKLSRKSYEQEPYSEEEANDYLSEREKVERKLNPMEVSRIPQTERVQEVPEKPKGAKRLVVFGDTNGAYGSEGQKYLTQLQQRLPAWNADFVIGVGDYIAAGGGGVSDERYKELNAKVKEEFRGFKTPFALALGNHDINLAGDTDNLKEVFKNTLKEEFEYEESDGGYSYKLGNATFVVFNEGNAVITDAQIDFFSQKSAEANGAVYLINHIPPFQHAYGPGLPKDGSESLKNFDKIQELARKNIEEKGRPFYVIGGHDHFHTVIGNFLNPGGMGSAYFGPDGSLKSNPSAAVVDIDADGKIMAVYFRDAKSDFKNPLPEIQEALAWGDKAKLEEKRPIELNEGQSVVDQITFNLSPEQIGNARIIEEEFKAAGLPGVVIAAAIINAHSESGLRNIKAGGSEESYGLFQINIPARRGRVTGEDMLDPRKNCQEILKEIAGKHGSRLKALARQGASVSELTAIFCYDIERPGARAISSNKRADKAMAFFMGYG